MPTTIANRFIAADHCALYSEYTLPDTEPRALVLIVHGYAEHSGRYRHVVEALVNAGYGVHTLDHRGHGKSEGLRAYVEAIDLLVSDLRRFIGMIRSEHPNHLFYVLGHSMGALISFNYALRHQDTLNGMILSALPIHPNANIPDSVVKIAYALNNFVPRLALARTVPPEYLSRDPAVTEAYKNDPLNYTGLMRVRTGISIDQAAQTAIRDMSSITIPTLFLHGGADRIARPSGSETAYAQISSVDKMLKIYPNLYHEIFNEPEKETVLNDMIGWLNQRVR